MIEKGDEMKNLFYTPQNFIAKLSDGSIVSVDDVIKSDINDIFLCPCCNATMTLRARNSTHMQPHFKHENGNSCLNNNKQKETTRRDVFYAREMALSEKQVADYKVRIEKLENFFAVYSQVKKLGLTDSLKTIVMSAFSALDYEDQLFVYDYGKRNCLKVLKKDMIDVLNQHFFEILRDYCETANCCIKDIDARYIKYEYKNHTITEDFYYNYYTTNYLITEESCDAIKRRISHQTALIDKKIQIEELAKKNTQFCIEIDPTIKYIKCVRHSDDKPGCYHYKIDHQKSPEQIIDELEEEADHYFKQYDVTAEIQKQIDYFIHIKYENQKDFRISCDHEHHIDQTPFVHIYSRTCNKQIDNTLGISSLYLDVSCGENKIYIEDNCFTIDKCFSSIKEVVDSAETMLVDYINKNTAKIYKAINTSHICIPEYRARDQIRRSGYGLTIYCKNKEKEFIVPIPHIDYTSLFLRNNNYYTTKHYLIVDSWLERKLGDTDKPFQRKHGYLDLENFYPNPNYKAPIETKKHDEDSAKEDYIEEDELER